MAPELGIATFGRLSFLSQMGSPWEILTWCYREMSYLVDARLFRGFQKMWFKMHIKTNNFQKMTCHLCRTRFLKKVPADSEGPRPGPGPSWSYWGPGPGPGPGPAFTHSSTRLLDIYPMTIHLSNDNTFVQWQDIYPRRHLSNDKTFVQWQDIYPMARHLSNGKTCIQWQDIYLMTRHIQI